MSKSICARVLVVCAACAVLASAAIAGALPDSFRLEPVIPSGLTEPSSMDRTTDGRILITERTTGNLRVIAGGELQAAPLCTVAVNATGEGGLLGVAAHPRFPSNGFVYLYFTDSATNTNKVRRFTIGAGGCSGGFDIVGNLGAGPSFLRNGGGLAFGPDGKLYIGAGDVESSGNGQDLGTLFGKILRVNDDGSAPVDNPTPGSLVYASGIRDARGVAANAAGHVYATDSGANPSIYDELNRVRSGGNYGWDAATGSSGGVYDDPMVSYSPILGVRGLDVMESSAAFPNRNADTKDNDGDRFGVDTLPGVKRFNDNTSGECVGSVNTGLACTTNANCPPRTQFIGPIQFTEVAFCEMRDDAAEFCPGGIPFGDDRCGSAGTDEADETFLHNVFFASDSANKLYRGVTNPADLTQLVRADTFLDSAFLADCPDNWTDTMAGGDGFLYATARNAGGASGGLYRVIYDDQPGAREVSKPGSPFPLRIDKTGGSPDDVVISWEDLRSDATQPRDDGNPTPSARQPLPPAREYTLWKGTFGSWSTHAIVPGFDATPGTVVNEAVRRATIAAGPDSYYFLASARHANLQGTLGKRTDGTERPGYPATDTCAAIGMHVPDPGTSAAEGLWMCGQDFTVLDERGETHSLYEYRESVIMLDLSAIWCPPCQAEADVLENMNTLYKNRGVRFLTVLMDEDDQVLTWMGRPTAGECRNWSDRAGANPDHTFRCAMDPNVTSPATKVAWPKYNNFGALPTNVIMDTGLRVVYSGAGYDEATLKDKLNRLVGTTDACMQ